MLQQAASLQSNGAALAPWPFPNPIHKRSAVNPSADTPRPIIKIGGSSTAYRSRAIHRLAASAVVEPQIANTAVPTQGDSTLDDDSSTSHGAIAAFLAFALLALPWRGVDDVAPVENEPEKQKVFSSLLLRSLEVEPVEVGYSHPAVQIMEDAIAAHGVAANRWIVGIYLSNYGTRPAIVADLLRCISRLEHSNIQPWGILMAVSALSHPDPELREAAVRAFEIWGGTESVDVLKTRVDAEPLPWLADYMRQVITDLTG